MWWFGESWGAPACEEETHEETPVGLECPECNRPIQEGDQGVAMPLLRFDAKPGDTVEQLAYHLPCWLKHIQPHDFNCPNCRGRNPDLHHENCGYRLNGDPCECYVTWDSTPEQAN